MAVVVFTSDVQDSYTNIISLAKIYILKTVQKDKRHFSNPISPTTDKSYFNLNDTC